LSLFVQALDEDHSTLSIARRKLDERRLTVDSGGWNPEYKALKRIVATQD
jgi:hypothetical protein